MEEVRSRFEIDVRIEQPCRVQIEMDVVLRFAAFKKTDAYATKPKSDDESLEPLPIGVVRDVEWVRVQKAAMKD